MDKFISWKSKFSKVHFYNSDLWKQYLKIISILSTIATLLSIFLTIPENEKSFFATIFVVFLVIIFVVLWYYANQRQNAHLKINQTNINVFIGDIFKTEKGELYVIGFNEYFDTLVDNRVISSNTLNGQFINSIVRNIHELDLQIREDRILQAHELGENTTRTVGKKSRYELGSVFEYDNFILTTFTKFDEQNKAYLYSDDYLGFWMNFWGNIDEIYAGRTINIPLMGAGITRFRDGKPSKQELLEVMLWTIKISGFYCTYSNRSVNFIISPNDAEEIDFYHIQYGLSFR